jgi:hypothetical protein
MLELQGAPLFDTNITICKYGEPSPDATQKTRPYPCLDFGWYASLDPEPRNANVRGPAFQPPQDAFAALREQRRIVFDNMPETKFGRERRIFDTYGLLHNFNVTWISAHMPRWSLMDFGKRVKRTSFMADFETQDEAEFVAAKYNGSIFEGRKLHVRKWQMPKKFLGASWDVTTGGEHFSGTRDQGSAVGTNFEEVCIG